MDQGLKNSLSNMKYLVTVDDDPLVNEIVEASVGMKSLSFATASSLLTVEEHLEPVGIFIDVHLDDDESGIEAIPQIQKRWPYAPLIVITGDRDDAVVGQALAAGAHDFVTKPLNPSELLARLSARRQQLKELTDDSSIRFHDFALNLFSCRLSGPTDDVMISKKDICLLKVLVENAEAIVTSVMLKAEGWGGIAVSDSTLHRKLHEVRKILRSVGSATEIKSVYGRGFVLRTTDHEDRKVLFQDSISKIP